MLKQSLKKRKSENTEQENNKYNKCLTTTDVKINTSQSKNDLLNNFKEGDLLFGLSKHHRNISFNELRKRSYPYLIANDLNKSTVRLLFNNNISEKKFKNILQNLKPYRQQHYHFLKKHEDYFSKPNGKPIPNMLNEPKIAIGFRRSCKLLVCNANENQKVHMELDHIDIARICEKRPEDLGVTNSEIRALYRLYKKGKENSFVFFYNKGIACEAPWKKKENQAAWDHYDDLRSKKLKK